jgi:hypothetical protein
VTKILTPPSPWELPFIVKIPFYIQHSHREPPVRNFRRATPLLLLAALAAEDMVHTTVTCAPQKGHGFERLPSLSGRQVILAGSDVSSLNIARTTEMSDLASFSIFPATPDQVLASRKHSWVQWAKGMSIEDYLLRDELLEVLEHAADGKLTTW